MADQGSGERTEKATPKKRRDAREKGQIMKSNEVNTAASLLLMFGLLSANWQSFVESFSKIMSRYLSPEYLVPASRQVDGPLIKAVGYELLLDFVQLMLPLFAAAVGCALVVNILQTRFLFTTKTLEFKFDKINPISGFKRLFSMNSLIELLKSLIKAAILAYMAYGEYTRLMPLLPGLMGQSPYKALGYMMSSAFSLALKLAAALAVIAAADYLYQWWRYEKDMMMTKQEIKEEYKQSDGDPQIKGKIRQKQRQMSMLRMMQRLPEADVVITNPTHYALALRYKEGEDKAPLLLAKGQGFVAARIKDKAKELKIEIVENKPLARALYDSCEVGSEIPPELYQAVADILVYVYKRAAL